MDKPLIPPSRMELLLKMSCPECTSDIEVPTDALEGELLVCDHCGVELELVSRNPVKVELFEEEEK